MIVEMKKVTIFAGAGDADEALEALREVGVLHVQLQRTAAGSCADIEQKIERVTEALAKIGSVKKPETLLRMPDLVVKDVLELSDKRERLLVAREELETKLGWYATWGDVSLQAVGELADAGVFVRLYSMLQTEYDAIAGTDGVYKVGEHIKRVLVAQVTVDGEPTLDMQEEHLPAQEKRCLLDDHYRVDEELAEVDGKLAFLGNYRMMLEEYRRQLGVNLEFAAVRESLALDQGICHLQGFAPVDALDGLRSAAEGNGWAYMFEEPDDDDDVPTLIRNPKWVRTIDPVMAFLGTIPGYRELDISLWFLVFFALFVAILVGDAGYGFIYLFGALLARRKFRRAPAEPFILMYVLSACTIVWGTLSGTWFGSVKIASLPFLSSLVVPAISSFDLAKGGIDAYGKPILYDNTKLLMGLCFTIGAVHLTLAHLLAAAKKSNSPKAIAEIGWVALIWGLYCLTRMLVLEKPLPAIGPYLLVGGSIVALLFTNYRRNNILKGVGETLIEFPLALIGGFSDVVSYLRLFAVGYTSLVLASSFNGMAAGIKGPAAGLGAALVLFFGHSLNLVLAGMGVIVHGVRLKMLEFSGHVGNEWSGRKYEPFSEKSMSAGEM